jgi:hypothetical protein
MLIALNGVLAISEIAVPSETGLSSEEDEKRKEESAAAARRARYNPPPRASA